MLVNSHKLGTFEIDLHYNVDIETDSGHLGRVEFSHTFKALAHRVGIVRTSSLKRHLGSNQLLYHRIIE